MLKSCQICFLEDYINCFQGRIEGLDATFRELRRIAVSKGSYSRDNIPDLRRPSGGERREL
jgi:hypothetical protein